MLRLRLAGLLAVAALLLLSGTAGQDAPTPSPRPDPFEGRQINVCTSDFAPIARCLDREPSQYTGYDIALFDRVRDRLDWDPERLNWTCLEWYEMLGALEAGDGTCDIAVAGIDISNKHLDAGITFSLPTLRGGYKLMVLPEQGSTNYWVFMDAFEWQLWVAIIATCIVVGLVVWAAERWAWIKKPADLGDLPDLQTRMWGTLGRPMQTTDMTARNFSASLIVLIFSFMALILTTLYTANTAANLTAETIQNRIRSVADLPGKRVGTWEDPEYITDLRKRNIDAIGYRWNDDADLEHMFDALRSGEIQALVLDSYLLDWAAGSRCDLASIGIEWEQYDQAIAFQAGLNNPGLIAEINRALVTLKESGDMENLASQYITPQARCKTSGVTETTSQVSFKEVSGLWILLGATVAAALIIYLAGQLTLCAARRVANTQAYKQSARRMKSLRSSITMRRYSTSASVKRRTSSSGRDATAICRADLEDASDEQGGSEVSVAVNDVLVRVQQLQQLLAKKPG